MNVRTLLEEYDLDIDDVRWYLCDRMVESFFTYKDDKNELIRYIWSGKLEANLYNMEESFLSSLQEDCDNNIEDEAHIRTIFSEIEASKTARFQEEE